MTHKTLKTAKSGKTTKAYRLMNRGRNTCNFSYKIPKNRARPKTKNMTYAVATTS